MTAHQFLSYVRSPGGGFGNVLLRSFINSVDLDDLYDLAVIS